MSGTQRQCGGTERLILPLTGQATGGTLVAHSGPSTNKDSPNAPEPALEDRALMAIEYGLWKLESAMTMTLYGTTPSPFVRRIRLLLDGVDYHFEDVPLYDDAGRQQYGRISPIRKVPALEDSGERIFDSHIIHQYLQRKLALPELTITQYNQISVIDAVTDSCVILVIGGRSELPVQEDRLLFKLQRERIEDSLQWLEQQATDGAFNDWQYPTMCLLTMIEWLQFRQLHTFEAYPALLAVQAQYDTLPIVDATRPV